MGIFWKAAESDETRTIKMKWIHVGTSAGIFLSVVFIVYNFQKPASDVKAFKVNPTKEDIEEGTDDTTLLLKAALIGDEKHSTVLENEGNMLSKSRDVQKSDEHANGVGIARASMDPTGRPYKQIQRGQTPNLNLSSYSNQPKSINRAFKVVLIWAYARGGSSILGEIFNQNRKAFYWFEPEVMMKLFLYGENWLQTEGLRTISTFRKQKLYERLAQVLNTCHFMSLPSVFMTNEHIQMMDEIFRYDVCKISTHKYSTECKPILDGIIATNPEKYFTMTYEKLISEGWFGDEATTLHKNWEKYRKCLPVEELKQCKQIMTEQCLRSDLRVAKLIKVGPEEIDWLLRKLPKSTKVIHYFRDPRAVAVSRCRVAWNMEKPCVDDSFTVQFVGVICHKMRNDRDNRISSLEVTHSGAFIQLKYIQLIRQPYEFIERIYSFIKSNLPLGLIDKVFNGNREKGSQVNEENAWNTHRQDPMKAATNWKQYLKPNVLERIRNLTECQLLFNDLEYEL